MIWIFEAVITALWLMLPAYIANPTAALLGGGTPIDLGRKFLDGKRILGDGKTFQGLFAGTGCGILAGMIQIAISDSFKVFPGFTFISIVCLSFGSLFGDLVKSFFKRRLGYERGKKLPIIDQLDFVAGAWLLTFIFSREWFMDNFTPQIMIIVLLITPVLHRLTNMLGYRIRVKKEPW